MKHPGVALSVLGMMIYFCVWIGHNAFYSRFDLRPEDVGFSYAAALVRSVGLIPLVVLMMYVLMMAVLVPLGFAIGFIEKLTGKSGSKIPRNAGSAAELVRKRSRMSPGNFLTLLVILAFLATVLYCVGSARREAERLRNREQIGGVGVFPDPYAIYAVPVTVERLDHGNVPNELVYFGTNGTTAVFYNQAKDVILRLPSDAIIICPRRQREEKRAEPEPEEAVPGKPPARRD